MSDWKLHTKYYSRTIYFSSQHLSEESTFVSTCTVKPFHNGHLAGNFVPRSPTTKEKKNRVRSVYEVSLPGYRTKKVVVVQRWPLWGGRGVI